MTKIEFEKLIENQLAILEDFSIMWDSYKPDFLLDEVRIKENKENTLKLIDLYKKLSKELIPLPYYAFIKSLGIPDGKDPNRVYSFETPAAKAIELLTFFEQIGYARSHVAIIGANGSGKTFLINHLMSLQEEATIIPAHRSLNIPTNKEIQSIDYDKLKRSKNEHIGKSHPENHALSTYSHLSFSHLMYQAIDEHIMCATRMRRNQDNPQNQKATILEKTVTIWNTYITHRTLIYHDEERVFKIQHPGGYYDMVQASDGEKMLLFLIVQVLLAKENTLIIIDEPEMYIHRAILNKLWDRLEQEQDTCIFIYMTHDIEFVTTRTFSKRLWLRSYEYPVKWDMYPISNEDIPEHILLEMLGSRRPVLFCEGDRKSSLDRQIYEILFPEYTIRAVGSCSEVISYTKAFNKIPNINISAQGIIDRDQRPEDEIKNLKKMNIHVLNYSEIENVLLERELLTFLLKKWDEKISIEEIENAIMDIFNIEGVKESLAKEYWRNILMFQMRQFILDGTGSLDDMKKEMSGLFDNLSDDKLYLDKLAEFNEINDYDALLKVYNEKDLHHKTKIQHYQARALKFLKKNRNHEIIKKLRNKISDF